MTATSPHPFRAEAAQWMIRMRQGMQIKRPDDVWFAATFHPTLGRHSDMESAAAKAQGCLSKFDASVARHLISRRWSNRRALMKRPWAALIGQQGAEGLHFHGMLAVPPDQKDRFLSMAKPAWKVATYGSIDLSDLTTPEDWAAYATRQLQPGQPVIFAALPYSSHPLPYSAPPPPPAHAPSEADSFSTALAA